MSDELERLMKELRAYISLRGGKLTLKDLIKWSEEQELSVLMLDMIINEMIKRGVLKASKEREAIEIGVHLTVELPKELRIIYKTRGEDRAHIEERKRKVQRKRPTSVALITEFITKEKVSTPSERREVKAERVSVEERKSISAVSEQKTEELSADQSLKKVITYLNNYRSVGEIRFLLDLKAMGIKNPNEVLESLLKLGYVTRSPLGVINVTEKLPKVAKDRKISEILFGA